MRIVGSLPFIGGLCGDFSPHRTTMTQTKCCPIFAFWVVVVCVSNGSYRSHRALKGSSLPSCFFPFVFLLRRSTLALRLGVSGSWQRSDSYLLLCRYGRRSGQPSSSSLARRACVHVLPFSLPSIPVYVVRRVTPWYAVTGFPRVHGQALLELWKSP